MLTLTKKTWKYIFYAVIALVLLYVVFFSSTRERFASVNPLPTAADLAAVEAALKREGEKREGGKQPSWSKMAAGVLKTAPESIKAAIKFSRANIIPLLPYNAVKANTNDDGSDNFDYWTLVFIPIYKDIMILPLAYAVKQQSSPPTLPAFIDMVVKIFRDNSPQSFVLNSEQQGLIDQAKKGETTMQFPGGEMLPNPGYWLYTYIYGKPKATSSGSSTTSSTTSRTPSGSIGGGGKCTPSVLQIPGGVTETRCFSS
jgi:hypothetical protein